MFEFKLHAHDEDAWAALGSYLVEVVAADAGFVGLCLEGQFPATELALSWTQRLTGADTDSLCVVDLHWANEPWLPGSDGGRATLNVALCTMQAANDASWISSIWASLDSEIFDAAADLAIAVYDNPWGATVWRDTLLTFDRFTESLGVACAWIKAGDGWSYLVGLREGSKIHERLVRRPRDL